MWDGERVSASGLPENECSSDGRSENQKGDRGGCRTEKESESARVQENRYRQAAPLLSSAPRPGIVTVVANLCTPEMPVEL